ncbi:Arc family DNA-binding protein [Citrobacter sp. Cpo069]|uniref:Arc family DNA-binding protein n=1 Tax=Citrobacter sp. Cpo069 TaxID=2985132 RepID=UPI002577FEB6|nr:Arc family DNA-binding protein [Citrobacter sp. Cpo069]MDM2873856.1 Arc family DNA-binding protein [Citrobacter sp. Cpo069]
MMNKDVKQVNPIQLRLPTENKNWIASSAEKTMRTMHSEIVYRLKLLQELEEKGVVTIQ